MSVEQLRLPYKKKKIWWLQHKIINHLTSVKLHFVEGNGIQINDVTLVFVWLLYM